MPDPVKEATREELVARLNTLAQDYQAFAVSAGLNRPPLDPERAKTYVQALNAYEKNSLPKLQAQKPLDKSELALLETIIKETEFIESAWAKLPANYQKQLQPQIARANAWLPAMKAALQAPIPAPLPTAAPLPQVISASVGYKGKNLEQDAILVKTLLANYNYSLDLSTGYDKQLEAAIYDFQVQHCGMSKTDLRETQEGKKIAWADGTISPNGGSWKILKSGKSLAPIDESKYTAVQKNTAPAEEPQNNPQAPTKPRALTGQFVLDTCPTVAYVEFYTSIEGADLRCRIESYAGQFFDYPVANQKSRPRNNTTVYVKIVDDKGRLVAKHQEFVMNYVDTLKIHVVSSQEAQNLDRQRVVLKQWEGYELQKAVAHYMLKGNPVGRISDSLINSEDIFAGVQKTYAERFWGVATGVVDIMTMGYGGTGTSTVFMTQAGFDAAAFGGLIPKPLAEIINSVIGFSGDVIEKGFKKAALELGESKIKELKVEAFAAFLPEEHAENFKKGYKLFETAAKTYKGVKAAKSDPEVVAIYSKAVLDVIEKSGLKPTPKAVQEAQKQIKAKYKIYFDIQL